MSARLNSQYEKFADIPKGIFEQFERRLEAAGCKPGLIQEFVRQPDLLKDWVREGNRIVEQRQFDLPTTITLPNDGDIDNFVHIATHNGHILAGRIREQLHDGSVRLVLILMPNQKMWEASVGGIDHRNEWIGLIDGVEIRLIGDNHFEVRQRRVDH